jgi:hypothetical protein
MGLDVCAIKYLNYCKKYQNFNKTISLGRQQIHTDTKSFFGGTSYHLWCEELLINEFKSTTVDSMDISNFEGANIIHDLNKIVDDKNIIGAYDTVLDIGTLEHLFNINNALINVSKLCKVGGQIIHVLPTNQQCGHGFWQFSPELFFSLYTEKNGYSDTEVFTANYLSGDFEKLNKPENGQRLLIHSESPTYVAVRTKLRCENFSHQNVQQSDYIPQWKNFP